MDEFRQYRYRKLPHFRLRGACYFVTWRLAKLQPELTPTERSVVVDTLRHFDRTRYQLDGFVVMNDHVHVVVLPCEGHELEKIVHSWKSFSANRLQRHHGRTGAVWQSESFDRVVRGEREHLEKLRYILGNPAKRWPQITAYSWVWALGLDEDAIGANTRAGTEDGR